MQWRLHGVLVDDDPDWLGLMQRSIWSTQLDVDVASFVDGRTALEYVRSHPVDFLVTDLFVPELDGLTLIEEVRWFARTLLIVLTSADESVAREALAGGSNFFIPKRNLYLQLAETLKDTFKTAQSTAQTATVGRMPIP